MAVRKLLLVSILAVLALAAAPSRASADWYLTPFVGGNVGGNANFGGNNSFDDEVERRGFGREPNDVLTALFRKRAPRVDLGPNRVAVVDKIEKHNDQRRNRRARRELSLCGFCGFCVVLCVISERTPFRRLECAPSGDSPAAEWGRSYRD